MRCIFHENFRVIDSVIVSEREIQVDKEELNRTKLTVTEILQHTSVLGVQRFPAH